MSKIDQERSKVIKGDQIEQKRSKASYAFLRLRLHLHLHVHLYLHLHVRSHVRLHVHLRFESSYGSFRNSVKSPTLIVFGHQIRFFISRGYEES